MNNSVVDQKREHPCLNLRGEEGLLRHSSEGTKRAKTLILKEKILSSTLQKQTKYYNYKARGENTI